MAQDKDKNIKEEALAFHCEGKPGKIEITPTKPLMTQRDLSLAYSPGVAAPCEEIARDPDLAYKYTSKGNMVAVISNGTAVLGLGNLGALASKPVMEGKSVLFKRFADIDSVDIEVDTADVDEFVNCVKYLGPSWGGINLEDIAAPECFIIEQKLKEVMDIPVFHDDQHGTAIICAAGLINAAEVAGKKLEELTVVVNGAGSAGIACLELIKRMGVPHNQVILCDRDGVVYQGRTKSMNQWKSAHAIKTDKRTLLDAFTGANVFLGLSAPGVVSQEMVKAMAPNPVIFAMANPIPEIMPEEVAEARSDAIVGTGRSDYPNQVNNVMGFPYIFRGALDVNAREINEEMKIAAANALAQLAREDVPEEVLSAYQGKKLEFGKNYIIPTPFDPRLITTIPVAVAQAAMDSGVARRPITDMEDYIKVLAGRRDRSANSLTRIFDKVKKSPKTIIFAEGEDENVIRAALQWRDSGFGKCILVGRSDKMEQAFQRLGVENRQGLEIANAAISKHNDEYIDYLYNKLQRQGFLKRDVTRMVKNDRNTFASCILALGHGDAMVTGRTRNATVCLNQIRNVIDTKAEETLFGMSMMLTHDRTVFIADTVVNELPNAVEMADIAVSAAKKVREMGHEPRVAFLAYSNFGNPMRARAEHIREAVKILDERGDADFEYEGELTADVALNEEMRALYPFSRLTKPANILIMPGLHSAHISTKMLQQLGDGVMIGPILSGLENPVQIVQMSSNVGQIMNLAAVAASDAIGEQK
ncbi:MAG: NADP-dependent malic enzyme [Rickettsiales bacterium]|nr:NADP-dependent malic enzyme [Rickettsiales bacterium]